MKPPRHPSVAAQLCDIQPLGDCVLVRRVDGKEHAGLIVIPQGLRNPARGLRVGEVVAVGPGDKLLKIKCGLCGLWREFIPGVRYKESHNGEHPVPRAPLPCRVCGSSNIEATWTHGRADMNLKAGDQIVYSRTPANNVVIDGQEYVFLHEAQHIDAVLEA